MDNLVIKSFSDKKYSKQIENDIVLKINPSKFKFEKEIKYKKDMQLGALGGTSVFDKYSEQNFSFETTLDATGVLPKEEDIDNVYDMVSDLEKRLYIYNSDGHRPPYVIIVWGPVIFKGQLTKMETQYTMFGANGLPLRAVVSFSFCGFLADDEERKKAGKSSPDMSHLITMNAGQSIAFICQQIYNDSLLVDQIAKINGLHKFRKIKPGTELLFPHFNKG